MNENVDRRATCGSGDPPSLQLATIEQLQKEIQRRGETGVGAGKGDPMEVEDHSDYQRLRDRPTLSSSHGAQNPSHKKHGNTTNEPEWKERFAQHLLVSRNGNNRERQQPNTTSSNVSEFNRQQIKPATRKKTIRRVMRTRKQHDEKQQNKAVDKKDDDDDDDDDQDATRTTMATRLAKSDDVAYRVSPAAAPYSLFDKEYTTRKEARIATLRAQRHQQQQEEQVARKARIAKWETQRQREEEEKEGGVGA